MKIKKIRQKLLAVMLPVITFSIVLLIAIAYFESKSVIEKESYELLATSGENCANKIDAWETSILSVLDTAVQTMICQNMDEQSILSYEEQFLDTYDAFPNGIYIAQSNRHLIDASGWEPDADITTTDWYFEGFEHPDRMLFGEPYVDEYTGGYIVTASRHTTILGIDSTIAADVNLSAINEVVSSLEVTADGDAFVIDSGSGIILAGKDAAIATQCAYDLEDPFYAAVCDAIKSGNISTSTYGSYMASINPIEDTDWYIVTRALERNVFRNIRKIGAVLIVIGLLALAAVIAIVIIVINKITKPIDGLNGAIAKVSEGDFTIELNTSGYDEIAQMAKNMEIYIASMRKLLADVLDSVDTIETQSDASQKVSDELNDSANEQVSAMDVLLNNLRDLVASVGVIAENATALAETVMGITASSNEAIDTMGETKKEAECGKASMLAVDDAMKYIQDGMEKLEVSITDVGSATVKIEEITGTIKSIANKTNLLALNASIEAARAGEAGRGFAVVADEIKTLAATSGDAASEISDLIADVTALINLTVEESRENAARITDSVELVKQATTEFMSIYNGIEATNKLVQNIISEIIQANDVATNMAAITQEQSAAAQEIEVNAVNIKELAEIVQTNGESVSDQSEHLSGAAEVLRRNMSRFKL